MLNIPILKFDKSIKYLESQIDIQKNNKHLILDIITNIGLILNTSSTNDNLQDVLDTANNFLQTISNNITTLEQLNLEITNITKDLNEIICSKSQANKTKEFYIAAFSNIKNNIVQYTEKFQSVEKKLEQDNINFNDFINVNDFKYNFNTVLDEEENNSTNYEFTGFSINNESTIIKNDDISNEISIETKIQYEEIEKENYDRYSSEIEFINEDNNIVENIEELNDSSINDELEKTNDISLENEVINNEVSSEENEKTQKINELTNEFKEILTNLYDLNSSDIDTTSVITNYFKEILDSKNISTSNLNNEIIDINSNEFDNDVSTKISNEDSTEILNVSSPKITVENSDTNSPNISLDYIDSLFEDNTSILDSISDDEILDDISINDISFDELDDSLDIDDSDNTSILDGLSDDEILEDISINDISFDELDDSLDIDDSDNTSILDGLSDDEILEDISINDISFDELDNSLNIDDSDNTSILDGLSDDEILDELSLAEFFNDNEENLSSDLPTTVDENIDYIFDSELDKTFLNNISSYDSTTIMNNQILDNSSVDNIDKALDIINQTTVELPILENNTLDNKSLETLNNIEELFDMENNNDIYISETNYSDENLFNNNIEEKNNLEFYLSYEDIEKKLLNEIQFSDNLIENTFEETIGDSDLIADITNTEKTNDEIENSEENKDVEITENTLFTSSTPVFNNFYNPSIEDNIFSEYSSFSNVFPTLNENVKPLNLSSNSLAQVENKFKEELTSDTNEFISNLEDTNIFDNNIENLVVYNEDISNNDFNETVNTLDEVILEEANIFDNNIENLAVSNENISNNDIIENDDILDDTILENIILSDNENNIETIFNSVENASDILLNDIDSNTIEESTIESSSNSSEITEDSTLDQNDSISENDTSRNSNPIRQMIRKIKKAESSNKYLIISEKNNSIYLPYTISELISYIENYPNEYSSLTDVVKKEFIIDLKTFIKHPYKARFSESYNLFKNREGLPTFKSLSYSLKIAKLSNLDPSIIAACKSEYEFESYLDCLKNDNLKSFRPFKIIYDVNPL